MATHSKRPHLATSPFNARRQAAPAPQQFEVGDRVTHDRFGMGRVTGLEGTVATCVDFGSGNVRIPLDSGRLHLL
jgi:hypothetical protein